MNLFPQSKLPVVYCLTVLSCLSAVSVEGAKEATQEEIENIALAIPDKIEPQKKHKVLVFSKAFTYYHSSIAVAKEMAKQMGEKTGLFDADFTNDPNDLSAENLKNYDAGSNTYQLNARASARASARQPTAKSARQPTAKSTPLKQPQGRLLERLRHLAHNGG